MKSIHLLAFVFLNIAAHAQPFTPEITSWIINTTGSTGYNGIPTNVQQLRYSDDNVYVTCTCIPGYDIGPWTGNPNTPANQDFCFKITRHPQEKTGTKTATPLGHIGTWSNGVSIFNANDGMSYQNQNIWHRDALVFEGTSFDNCLGHPAPNGEYHHHVNPVCLYDHTDGTLHSPIIGYAFDGFPIYGAYAYKNADSTGGIARMKTAYQKRNITTRTTLPDGTVLPANQYGPAIGGNFPLGAFIEDYEFVAGSGDLDAYNGRFCVTPEYPNGIYAYFVTIGENLLPEYPYTLGPSYYGVVQAGNTGPQSGHNVPSEPVQIYTPTSGTGEALSGEAMLVSPNPTAGILHLDFSKMPTPPLQISLYNTQGEALWQNSNPAEQESLDMSGYPAGAYRLWVLSAEGNGVWRMVVKI